MGVPSADKTYATTAVRKAVTTDHLTCDGADPITGFVTELQTSQGITAVRVKWTGIAKKIAPHIFRHSRVTHLINQGMKESVIKLMMWGNLITDTFASLPPTSPARTLIR